MSSDNPIQSARACKSVLCPVGPRTTQALTHMYTFLCTPDLSMQYIYNMLDQNFRREHLPKDAMMIIIVVHEILCAVK